MAAFLDKLKDLSPKHEDHVPADQISLALVDALVEFQDGAKQDFQADGKTLYIDRGHPWPGTWHIEGDQYCSIWPPSPSVACYSLQWWVESDQIVGLIFTDKRTNDAFTGRYVDGSLKK